MSAQGMSGAAQPTPMVPKLSNEAVKPLNDEQRNSLIVNSLIEARYSKAPVSGKPEVGKIYAPQRAEVNLNPAAPNRRVSTNVEDRRNQFSEEHGSNINGLYADMDQLELQSLLVQKAKRHAELKNPLVAHKIGEVEAAVMGGKPSNARKRYKPGGMQG